MQHLRAALTGPLKPYALLLAFALVGTQGARPAVCPEGGEVGRLRRGGDRQDVRPPQVVVVPLAAVPLGKPGEHLVIGAGPKHLGAAGSPTGPVSIPFPESRLRRSEGVLRSARLPLRSLARCALHGVFRL